LVKKSENNHNFVCTFREAVAFVMKERGETGEHQRLHYTRALCRAAVNCGELRLPTLTGFVDPWAQPYREPEPQFKQEDNNLAAAVYLGMHRSVNRQLTAVEYKNRSSYFGSPLRCAATIGDVELTKTLLASMSTEKRHWEDAWAASAELGHFEVLRLLIESGQPSLNYRLLETALRHASRGGYMEIVEFLLDNSDIISEKANNPVPNVLSLRRAENKAKQYWLEVVLITACCRGHDHIARLAFDRGARPFIQLKTLKHPFSHSLSL
jgi:hypothetical protein